MLVARHHSHSRAPVIEGALQAAIAKVRRDDVKNDWVLCGFLGGEKIKLIGTGVGGIEALKKKIVDWDVCYGLVRCTHTLEQAGYVQTDFVKFVWIYWRPDNIPVVRKMTIGVNEGEMKQLFAPYHAELQVCSMEELGPGPLADVLDTVTMRADKTGHHISRALSNQTLMERGRAAWALARSSLPPVHFARFAIADEQKKVAESEELVIEHHDEFAKAIKDIRSDMSSTDWCLVGYKDTTVLRMIGAGQGGLNALLDTAEPFGVNYGVLRVSEKLDLVYHEAYCFITWMPENVPAFVKARVSIHQGAVAAAFRQHVHCQFFFRGAEREDITLDIIRARVRQIIGKDGSQGTRRRRRSTAKASTRASTVASLPGPAAPSRPKYIAPKTRTSSLRGSIVIKADTINTADSPSAEEKQHFPKVFLDSLMMKRVAPATENARGLSSQALGAVADDHGSDDSADSVMVADTDITEDGEAEGEFEDEEAVAVGVLRNSERNVKNEPESVLTTVQEAVERVRKGGDGADYLVVEWRKQSKAGKSPEEQLAIKEVGSGGVEALANCFEEQSIMFGLVRVTETKNIVNNDKFCCVKLTPENAAAVDETQSDTLRGEVARLFHPYHGDLAAKNPSDVTNEAVSGRVGRRKQ